MKDKTNIYIVLGIIALVVMLVIPIYSGITMNEYFRYCIGPIAVITAGIFIFETLNDE